MQVLLHDFPAKRFQKLLQLWELSSMQSFSKHFGLDLTTVSEEENSPRTWVSKDLLWQVTGDKQCWPHWIN